MMRAPQALETHQRESRSWRDMGATERKLQPSCDGGASRTPAGQCHPLLLRGPGLRARPAEGKRVDQRQSREEQGKANKREVQDLGDVGKVNREAFEGKDFVEGEETKCHARGYVRLGKDAKIQTPGCHVLKHSPHLPDVRRFGE